MEAGQQIGPFVVERELGAGAMGAVYQARYTKTGLSVAIKVIAAGLDSNPTSLARFEREAEILKKLKHPNIVRLYATGRMRGKPFYAMEFVAGEPLDRILERRGRLSWEEVVTLGSQVCAALQLAHEQGIIHRDLKPANVMVTANGTSKLTDFGIAKMLDVVQLTATNTTVGTAAYMSPEQCRGEKILTPKSDLYALGVMFYELLTGRRPFVAETTLEMFLAHVQGTFERPSRTMLEIPIWLDTLVCQMLEKDPDKRPRNATAVAEALGRIREKVAAQRSAGVDMVSTNVQDRPRTDLHADEGDIHAARVLKAAVSRKRLRKRVKPLPQRAWFQAACLLAALVAIGGLWYWLQRPPAADALMRQAQRLVAAAASDAQGQQRARGAIQELFLHYPNQDDDEARSLTAWADDYDARRQELILANRMRVHMTPENDLELAARSALKQEEAGALTDARGYWQQLVGDAGQGTGRVWRLVAERHMRLIDHADRLGATLREQVEGARTRHQPLSPADGEEAIAARALRFEIFGDGASARKRWIDLKARAEEADRKPWYLLALKKLKPLEDEKPPPKIETLRKQLALAAQSAQAEPDRADLICRDVIELYAQEPDLVDQVRKAHDLLIRMGHESRGDDKPTPAPDR